MPYMHSEVIKDNRLCKDNHKYLTDIKGRVCFIPSVLLSLIGVQMDYCPRCGKDLRNKTNQVPLQLSELQENTPGIKE